MSQSDSIEGESKEALGALERFVVENDDLLELEEHIGRFNIFDALRIVDREVKHSDFLAWLLDPNESHGQGGLFLRAVLMDLFKRARENGFACPVSPIELDGEELRGVEIRREWRHIDLLIRCDEPPFVVAVENKVRSGEHSNQLKRYHDVVTAEIAGIPSMYVFLTVEGDEASEEDWVTYSYGDVHRVLQRVRHANASSIGDDVLAFLDHYLRLIRGRLMDDPKITELCQRIYKNHRQALELIYEIAGSPAAGLLTSIEQEILQHPGGWRVTHKTSMLISFMPEEWFELLPPIGSRPRFDRHHWISLIFEIRRRKAFFRAQVCPTSNPELRQRAIERLTQEQREFGFRLVRKKISDQWSQLASELIVTWPEEEGPDEEATLSAVRKKLGDLTTILAGIPEALRPIVESYQPKR